MDLGSATSSADYVNRICNTLPNDLNGPLAHFFRGEQHNANDVPAHFAWYCDIDSHTQAVPIGVSSPSELRQYHEHAMASGSCGGLVFLRGYPSQTWLGEIGYLYRVSPDYWMQHLGFLSPSADIFSHEHPLPSTRSHSIIQLRLGSIGARGRFRSPGYDRIEELRRQDAEGMIRYADQLAEGSGWKPGNSIVRQYVLHDREHFSIEQYVTIVLCLRPLSEGRPSWTGKHFRSKQTWKSRDLLKMSLTADSRRFSRLRRRLIAEPRRPQGAGRSHRRPGATHARGERVGHRRYGD